MAWSKIKFYWEETLASFSATSVASGFAVANLLDRLEGTFWQATSTADQYITFDAGVGNTYAADYLAIGGHNLYSTTATLGLQYSTGATTGSDLVTNGGFASDTTSWTASASSLASVGSGQDGNCLEVTNSGAASGSAYQDVTGLTVGETYKLSAYFKKGTGATGAIKVGTTVDDDLFGSDTGLTDAGWTEYTYTFVATETTARITFVNESAVSSETSLFDTATMYIVDWTDAFTGYTPTTDNAIVKVFSSQGKRLWRLKISGTPSAVVQIAISIWGEATELDYATSSYDPYRQTSKTNVNTSETGYVLGIHNKYKERQMGLRFSDSDSTLYGKVKTWWETNGMKNFFVAWEDTNNAADIFLMRSKESFNNPLTNGGGYRNITINLIGRAE